jgi:adenine-specific DNA-methyltransferase
MWYTKGDEYHFDLDSVRVPQKYPGKRHAKGPNKGEFSGNPRGKNPSDIWEGMADDVWHIPNVKANHVEKTEHPCQFPVGLATRLVRALCPVGGLVLDPFSGVASTGVATLQNDRRFLGAELDAGYAETGSSRLEDTLSGTVKIRPIDKKIYVPKPNEKVAMKPDHFWSDSLSVALNSI